MTSNQRVREMLRMWLNNWERSLRLYDKRCDAPLNELRLIIDSAPDETSRDAPDYEPVDFDHAVAVVRHFENYEYPPTFTDWPRCLAALRSMVNWVAKRRQLKTGAEP